MALDPTLLTGLSASNLRVFHAVRIELIDGGSINLLDGSGFVSFDVDGSTVTFDGEDSTYGTLANLGGFSESVATEAPRLSITLLPPTSGALGTLAAVENQGSPVRVWFGLVNESTGLVIGTPEMVWLGRLDTVKASESATTRVVELDVASVFDRLFPAEEAARLNDHWHQSIWPGETGLSQTIQATVNVPWGTNEARPYITPTTPTGGFTGGGGGGGGGGGFNDAHRWLLNFMMPGLGDSISRQTQDL